MSTARPILQAALLAALVVTVAPPSAWAQDGDEAATAFREGLRQFGAEDYAGARASFERAYRAQPNVRVLANIADCQAHEGNIAEAVMTYRRFLADAADDVPAAARRLVERRVADLRAQVCDLRVTVEPAGATILVDGAEIGTAPLPEPVAISSGEHRVQARLAGHETVTRTVQAREGGDLVVAVTLPVLQATPVEAEPTPPAPPPERESEPGPALGRGPLLWTGIGVTAALVLSGTVTGLLALSQQSEYEDPQTNPERRRELYEGRRTLPLITDVLLDGALLTGLATAGLYLFAGPRHDEPAAGSRALVSPRFVRGGGFACDVRLAF